MHEESSRSQSLQSVPLADKDGCSGELSAEKGLFDFSGVLRLEENK